MVKLNPHADKYSENVLNDTQLLCSILDRFDCAIPIRSAIVF